MPIIFVLQSEYFTKEALEGVEDFKIGGQVICTAEHVRYLCYWLRKTSYYRA
jgi:hypothetical protein